jgi:parvulin-like peptidyl-prolyl isomerase
MAAKPIAKVGDRVITLGEYAAAVERMDTFERMRYQSPDRRKRLLDEMIEVELLAQEARRRGLDKAEETQERVRQILRDQILDDLRKNAPAANDVPDTELHAYYDAHKDDFAEPERRRVSAIVFDTAAAAKTALAKAQKADATAWGQLVEQSSNPRGPRLPTTPTELAGDLGMVGPPGHPRGGNPRVPDPVREAVFKIANPGETYGSVVEADKKFYVVRMTSRTEGRARTFEEAQRAIRTAVVQAKVDEQEKALEKDLRAKFPVKIDDAALEKMPMPAPSSAPPAVGGPGGFRAGMPPLPGMPGMTRLPGVNPTPAPAQPAQ